jgi:hypothetical protein
MFPSYFLFYLKRNFYASHISVVFFIVLTILVKFSSISVHNQKTDRIFLSTNKYLEIWNFLSIKQLKRNSSFIYNITITNGSFLNEVGYNPMTLILENKNKCAVVERRSMTKLYTIYKSIIP